MSVSARRAKATVAVSRDRLQEVLPGDVRPSDRSRADSLDATRLLIVHDHPILREGLVATVHGWPRYKVEGAAGCIQDACELVGRRSARVVVLDDHLPDGDSASGCRRLLEADPGLLIVIVSVFDTREVADRAMSCGARGYVVKASSRHTLFEAIDTVCRGGRFVDPAVPEASSGLTSQEMRVLELLVAGDPNRAIAQRLCVSPDTVKAHIRQILKKLGARNRTDAVALAIISGIVRRDR